MGASQMEFYAAASSAALFGIILLILSLLLFGVLTVFHTSRILGPLNKILLDFCGWGAYPLALGLVALSLIYLSEGIAIDV